LAKKEKRGADPGALARNRTASHDYFLLEKLEAGIALTGTEVKSVRAGLANLKEAYARIENGEAFLHNAHISPYAQGNRENVDPVRKRKLLLHAREIRKLARETQAGGVTLVPVRLYLKEGRVKLELAVAKGKKAHDKREAKQKQEAEREMARARSLR